MANGSVPFFGRDSRDEVAAVDFINVKSIVQYPREDEIQLFPVSPVIRLPCSADFATGRGGFLQLLSMTLSPCCPYQPRRSVSPRQSLRRSMLPSPEKWRLGLRVCPFEAIMGLLALRPGDSLTTLFRWLRQ